MPAPLEGIKVLDLSRGGVGPFATMVLGDLGADILEIADPGGRPAREGAAARDALERERRGAAQNPSFRNKRRMTLNLRAPEARQVLHQLAQDADVFVESFRPGVTKRLEADYDRLKAINPRLVYCSITGFGQDGPYSDLPGHDINFSAVTGALALTRREDGAIESATQVGHFSGRSMVTVVGILAALMARERTGEGQYVDLALADATMSLLTLPLSAQLARQPAGDSAEEAGGRNPFQAVYEAQDGMFLSLGAGEPHLVDNLMRALGKEEYVGKSTDRKLHPAMAAFLRQKFKTRPCDDWFDYLRTKDVAIAKFNTPAEAVRDPQVLHRGMVVEAGELDGQPVKQVGPGGYKLSATPPSVRSVGVPRGQHTEEVLRGLGYTTERIAEMRRSGAI